MIDFLSGSVTVVYFLIAFYFLSFWKRTYDRLFVMFALSFALFGINQIAATMANAVDERTGWFYILRILGYGIILFAIIDKNTFSSRKQ